MKIARLTTERDIIQKDKSDWYFEKLHALAVNLSLRIEIAGLRTAADQLIQYRDRWARGGSFQLEKLDDYIRTLKEAMKAVDRHKPTIARDEAKEIKGA